MAGQTATVPGFAGPIATLSNGTSEQKAGPVLFLGGAAYAVAYIVVGVTAVSLWGALLAIIGTGLVLIGLRSVVSQAQPS